MHIRIQVTPDRRRLAAATRRAVRHVLLPFQFLGVLLWLLVVPLLVIGDPATAALYCVGGVVAFWGVPALVVHSIVRASWRMHGVPTVWEFTDEGVHTHNELLDSTIRWAALQRVEPMPGQLLFKINRSQVFPVPTADLAPEDLRVLVHFLRDRGLLRERDNEISGLAAKVG